MSHEFQKGWLKCSAIAIALFGPLYFFGTMEATREPVRWMMDLLSWPIDGATTWLHPDTHFLSALTGGFLLGWGIMIWCLAVWVFDVAPEGVRKSLVAGAVAWFFLDSAGSITSGNASNAFFNIIVLLGVVGPLWFPARQSVGELETV